MPELPEVETMVRGVRPLVEGRRIVKMEFCSCTRQPIVVSPTPTEFTALVRNRVIRRIHRVAKRIVLDLNPPVSTRRGHKSATPSMNKAERSERLHLVIEPRMTGLLLISDPPTVEHRRICWHLGNDDRTIDTPPISVADSDRSRSNTSGKKTSSPSAVPATPAAVAGQRLEFWDRRGLGTVRLLNALQFAELLNSLGIDALSIQPRQWRACFGGTARPIKVALLDQTRIAGIGNLYASEILHTAGIRPERPACELTDLEWKRIHTATRRILNTAIRYEGSTLGDGTYRNALNKDGSYQNQHRVYQKADQTCLTCGQHAIVRIVQSQRSTFFCPGCQR